MIDVQGLVASLVKAESRPITQMQTEAKKIDVKISAFGKLQSQLSAFRDAAAALSRFNAWSAVSAVSSNPNAVDILATTGASASQHALEVQQLAGAQTVTSGAFTASDTVVGSGTLRIQMGTQPTGAGRKTAIRCVCFYPAPPRVATRLFACRWMMQTAMAPTRPGCLRWPSTRQPHRAPDKI
jgi:flagellar capping protein FliD